MTLAVTKAVIPTAAVPRLLPASKAVPLELLPIAGVPLIEHVVTAASAVGLTDVLLVVDAVHRTIEDHFDRDPELERRLSELDDRAGLAAVRRAAALASIHAVRRRDARDRGGSLLLARQHVGDEPFAILAPDRLILGDDELLRRLVDTYAWSRQSVVAVPRTTDPRHVTSFELERYGRFVVTAELFDALDNLSPDLRGERTLGDALLYLARHRRLKIIGYDADVRDAGDRLDRLRTEIDLMLADPELRADVAHIAATAGRRPPFDAAA